MDWNSTSRSPIADRASPWDDLVSAMKAPLPEDAGYDRPIMAPLAPLEQSRFGRPGSDNG
jgi:hypothetical protein